mmetsp:Transcript_21303/g.68691  ORF Transcript_21303/g.68691 Transcript_21303/m.68691 type:complete len:402 (+) Transcript_21303:563-1768(+)
MRRELGFPLRRVVIADAVRARLRRRLRREQKLLHGADGAASVLRPGEPRAQVLVGSQRAGMAEHDQPGARARQRYVQPPLVGEEPHAAAVVGSDHGDDDQVRLLPLEAVDGRDHHAVRLLHLPQPGLDERLLPEVVRYHGHTSGVVVAAREQRRTCAPQSGDAVDDSRRLARVHLGAARIDLLPRVLHAHQCHRPIAARPAYEALELHCDRRGWALGDWCIGHGPSVEVPQRERAYGGVHPVLRVEQQLGAACAEQHLEYGHRQPALPRPQRDHRRRQLLVVAGEDDALRLRPLAVEQVEWDEGGRQRRLRALVEDEHCEGGARREDAAAAANQCGGHHRSVGDELVLDGELELLNALPQPPLLGRLLAGQHRLLELTQLRCARVRLRESQQRAPRKLRRH